MPAPEVHTHLLHPLNATGIPYMVTGGVAAIIYGEPRLTNDVDIVMTLTPDDAGPLAAAFPPPAYYAPPIEVIREEASTLKKLAYFQAGGSDRHLRDIAAMCRLSGDIIDQAALESWIHRLDLHREWELAGNRES